MHVLVIEDEPKIMSFIQKACQEEGFAVTTAEDGWNAIQFLRERTFDVVVMDIMMPGPDGLSVLRQYRDQGGTAPVLLLSGRGEMSSERVDGLNAGADDYLAKPFELAELAARVRALGRRAAAVTSVVLRLADLSLDTVSHEVCRAGKRIHLSNREFRLLDFLMRSQGRVRGRMAILESVWDYHFDPGTNLVDVCIRRLRDKIDRDYEPRLLHTVIGAGYVLKLPS